MKIFVLAGGIGERLQPYTELLPKCMFPIRGKPAVRYVIDALLAQKFPQNSIWVCIQDKDFLSFSHEFRDLSLTIKVSDRPMGTAGEVYAVREDIEGDFMVIYADDLTFRDYRKLLDHHLEVSRTVDVMATLVMTDNYRMPVGAVAWQPSTQKISGFTEKPVGVLPMWTGVGVFTHEVLEYMLLFTDFAKDVIPAMLADGKEVRGYPTHKPWVSINNIEQWRQANRDLEAWKAE